MELTELVEYAINSGFRFDITLGDSQRDLGSVEHLQLSSVLLDHRGLFISTQYDEQRMGVDDTEVWFGYRTTLTFIFGKKSHHLNCYVFNGLPDYLNMESWYDCMSKTVHTKQNPESRLVSDRGPPSRQVIDKYLELHDPEEDFQVLSSFAKSLLVPPGFHCFPLFRLFIVTAEVAVYKKKQHTV